MYLGEDDRCALMSGGAEAPAGPCPALPALEFAEAFRLTCLEWPHNTRPGEDLGGCCWEWRRTGGDR